MVDLPADPELMSPAAPPKLVTEASFERIFKELRPIGEGAQGRRAVP